MVRARTTTAVAVLGLVLLAACQPARTPLWSGAPSSSGVAVLTPDGTDRYAIDSTDTGVHAEALPSNSGTNLRVAFWPRGVDAVVDGESCARWSGFTGAITQQGAALRVVRNGSRVRAVTVTQNILYGARWNFNVHVWDTAADPPLRKVGDISLTQLFRETGIRGDVWVCARTLGDRAEVKVWRPWQAEPAWGDPHHGGAVDLPRAFRLRGQVGWYVGHLGPGEHADFSDLSTWTYDPQDRSRSGTSSLTGPDAVSVRPAA